ncbi:MAG: DNA adenine methylase [Candidatus Binatia bacterium]
MAFWTQRERAVNVASVPQRSPFRYPGGKTWLIPYIRQWLTSKLEAPALLIEPFAGGGIVSLTVAAERLARHVLMVERDEAVGVVWQTIVNDTGGGEWLAERIASFKISSDSVAALLATSASCMREQAFQTIVKNRVNRGGIMAPGAGLIKEGENGKGLSSRWYPQTLKRRILNIVQIRDRLEFIQGDGLTLFTQHASDSEAIFFIDPPYTVAGKRAGSRLYKYSEVNHEELFRLSSKLAGDFLMTYDDEVEVRGLAEQHGFEVRTVAMKSTHHANMKELLIGRDLQWLR